MHRNERRAVLSEDDKLRQISPCARAKSFIMSVRAIYAKLYQESYNIPRDDRRIGYAKAL